MRCFYHLDREAVGGCKSCGKGLCPECAVDLGKGLACRGRCEEDSRALIQLIDSNIKLTATLDNRMQASQKVISNSQRVISSSAIFILLLGGVFMYRGLVEELTFDIVLGVCFLGYGLFGLFRALAFSQKPKPPVT
jgi:hypothetical protein